MPRPTRPFGADRPAPDRRPPAPVDPRTVRITRVVQRPGRSDEPPKSWHTVSASGFDRVEAWADIEYDMAQDGAVPWASSQHLQYQAFLHRHGYGVATETEHHQYWSWSETMRRGDGWTDEEWAHLLHSHRPLWWRQGEPQWQPRHVCTDADCGCRVSLRG